MTRHARMQTQLQVLYLGHSADVAALRRSLEAHGAVTRTRLTPEVTAVVVDPAVSAHHPTVQSAYSIGIPVLTASEAADQLASFMGGQLNQNSGRGRHDRQADGSRRPDDPIVA